MNDKQITLAIFSPNQNAYSETFIQAHKTLPFNIKYYYDGLLPTKLEGRGVLTKFSLHQRFKKKFNKDFNLWEHGLVNSLKREKVNIVLTEFGPTAAASLSVIQFLNLPMIAHFFGTDSCEENILKQYGEAYKKVFVYAKKIVVVCEKMKCDLVSQGCPENKIIVSVCGPNPAFFEVTPLYKKRQFIAVGRFVEKKAPYLTILAFKKVTDKFPDARLIMLGDGMLLNVTKNLAEGLGLSANVEFRGVLSPVEIRQLFEESLAFVQHSITLANGDSEGTPVAILDAQASSLPVVSTYHAGIPDVVADKCTGLLVEEKNIDGMTENMLRLLTEEGLAKTLGVAGRERVMKYFTLEKHLSTLESIIKDTVQNN